MIENTLINAFMSGGIAVAFVMIGICFFRFWRQSHIRLFLLFSLAFYLLTIERIVLVLTDPNNEFTPYVYSIRLAAFVVIIIAIIDQNRTRSDG